MPATARAIDGRGRGAPDVAIPARTRLRRRDCLRTRVDRELTRPMVWMALIFLVVMAPALPHSLLSLSDESAEADREIAGTPTHRPAVADPGSDAAARSPQERLTRLNHLAVGALALLAIPFWLEAGLRLAYVERLPRPDGRSLRRRPSRARAAFIICCALVPPLRAGLHPATMRGHMWLPGFGWRRTSHRLSRRVQRAFGVPMLCIGLLILPVLLGELFLSQQARSHVGLAFGLDVATRLIWLAFALEFVVMMAVTPRKTEYAFRHWVDLVIILLPFVAFLRSLQVLRAGQLLKAQRMSQLARTYRLRAVAVKLLQAVLLLRVLEGLSERAAKRRITGLHELIRRRHLEIDELRAELRQLRRELAERKWKSRRNRRSFAVGAEHAAQQTDR